MSEPAPAWMRGNKPKRIWPTIRRYLRYIGPYRYIMLTIVVIGLTVTVLSIIGPQILGDLTDLAADSIEQKVPIDMEAATYLCLILILIYSCLCLLEYARTRMEWVYEEIIGNILRKDLSRKVSRIPVSQLDSMSKGDIMSRFVNDTDTIRLNGVECITRTIESVVMLVGCTVVMVMIDWRLTLAIMVPTLVGFVIIRMIVRLSQKYYLAQSRNLGRMNAVIEETYRGLNIVNVYNGLDGIKERFEGVNDDLYSASFRSRVMGGVLPEFTGFINNLGYVLVCIVGSLLILDGSATFGTLVTFIVYVKLCTRPLLSLSNSLGGLQEVAASAERVFEFFDTPEMEDESDATGAPEVVKGDILFDHVNFSYVPGTEIIHDLLLHVEPGQRIAIVGPTGAGKTTISNLLLRYYDPDSGSIIIDGKDTMDMRRDDVRGLFGVVLQDSWLFKGTLRQNLVFDRTEVDDERMLEVCRTVGLGHYVDGLPDGLDSMIEDPQTLSAGQRQQITIARAIIKDAPLLIMDEATSSVDTRTERAIQSAMDHLMEGRTSFVIAHRLSTIKSADLIIVIKKGSIIERGTHEELIAKGGFYRSLYDSQFEYCE